MATACHLATQRMVVVSLTHPNMVLLLRRPLGHGKRGVVYKRGNMCSVVCILSRTRAPVEEMDNKETTTSNVTILDAFEYEILGARNSGRTTLRRSVHEMPRRDKLYDFEDCMDRCEQDVTRCQDFPDDPVSQHVDPLPPLSGVNDRGREGPSTGIQEQAESSAAPQHTKDSPACNKNYKNKDVMLGASNHNKLPITTTSCQSPGTFATSPP